MGCCLSAINLVRPNIKRQKCRTEAVTLTLFPPQHSFQNRDGTTVPVLETIDFEIDSELWAIPSRKLKF